MSLSSIYEESARAISSTFSEKNEATFPLRLKPHKQETDIDILNLEKCTHWYKIILQNSWNS